ncbi:hypothetical protein BKA80DRAFT_278891 [Phyllosticta citrichinensis]
MYRERSMYAYPTSGHTAVRPSGCACMHPLALCSTIRSTCNTKKLSSNRLPPPSLSLISLGSHTHLQYLPGPSPYPTKPCVLPTTNSAIMHISLLSGSAGQTHPTNHPLLDRHDPSLAPAAFYPSFYVRACVRACPPSTSHRPSQPYPPTHPSNRLPSFLAYSIQSHPSATVPSQDCTSQEIKYQKPKIQETKE